MAAGRLQDECYLNWLRDSMALLFLKEGIEDITDKRVADFHRFLHQEVSKHPSHQPNSSCSICSNQQIQRHNNSWRVRCPTKVCNTWIKEILKQHADGINPQIACTNLQPQLWPTHAWEVAKCFLPQGNKHVNAAKDADVAAVLKLMKSCTFMYKFFPDRRLVQEVLEIRHALMHSCNMNASDVQLQDDTSKMIQLLDSLVDLSPAETKTVQRTIDNINKLSSKVMDVTLHNETIVLSSRMHAVESELASHMVKCSDYESKTRQDLTETSEDFRALKTDYQQTKAEITQLKKIKHSFEEFLQKNNLVSDVARLSKKIEEYGERFNLQDERIDRQDEGLDKLGERLNKQDVQLVTQDVRLGQQDVRLDKQDERLGQQDERLGQQDEQLDKQDERLGQQDVRLGQQDVRLDKQDERLGQQDERLGQQDERLDKQDEQLGQQDERLGQQHEQLDKQSQKVDLQGQRINNQDQRLGVIEESMKHKDDTAACKSTSSWEDQCKAVQQYLIEIYQTKCLWENPMTTDQQCIPDMYVPPAAKLMREKDEHGGLEEVKNVQSQPFRPSYQQIFSSPSGPCTNVYITGDAGTGKTTFCNQLALTWCRAVQNDRDRAVSAEDLTVLSQFKFLFYISLRDTEAIYHVEEMLEKFMKYAPISVDISNLLKTEKCLIVLDGLDEWSCPDETKCPGLNEHIPGRNIMNKNCVFLTTTRNWKYDVSDLKTKDVDKYIELCGIGKKSSEELAQKLVDYLDRKSKRPTKTNIGTFNSEVHQRKLSDLITVPVLLIQLVTLWYCGKDFGNSQLQMYCNMLDLLFERSEKRMSEKQSQSTCAAANKQEILLPECFSTKDCCQSHTELLLCLSKLAYKSLFNKQREEVLVFKSSKLDIFGISPSDINLCLQCGILSQNKDFGNYTGKYKKFSFLHKKMQEFLAAIHIVTVQPVENTLECLREFCSLIDIMTEMSQVWLFVSGMSPDTMRQLLKHFTNVINADKRVQNYRQSLDRVWSRERLIQDIQTFVTDCVIEGQNNGHTYENIGLEDLYIDRYTFRHVERLLPSNRVSGLETIYCRSISNEARALPGNVTSCLKSVYITDIDVMTVDQLRPITDLLLHSQAMQKLHLRDRESRITRETLTTFLRNCRNKLISLDLDSGVTLTESGVTSICRSISERLMALRLHWVRLTHVDEVKLLNAASQSASIRELHLTLYCTDHGTQCRPRIDVSTMTQLQTLWLWWMCVDNLPTVTQCMERVNLFHVTLSMATLCEFVLKISQTKRHVKVELDWLTVREESEDRLDLETFLRGCPGLTVTRCDYYDIDNEWWINFHTNKQ